MKKFRSFKDIRQFNFNCNPKRSQLVQPSIMAELSKVNVTYFDGDDKREAIANVDDIYMLFNQQRLDKMTREALIARFDSMSQYDDGMKALRQKCTDDQLISLVKSRYIQSPGELMEWSKYLNSLADVELKNIVQQAQLNSTQVDVSSGDNPTPQDSAVTAS